MHGKDIPVEAKLSVVLEILQGKESVDTICARHKVNVTEALAWQVQFLEGAQNTLDKKRLEIERKALLKENQRLRRLSEDLSLELETRKKMLTILEKMKKEHPEMFQRYPGAGQRPQRKSMKENVVSSYPVYQIKVSLKDIQPEIWRRILVPGNASLCALHKIIQAAFGWQNCHLHQFAIGSTRYSDPDFEPSETEKEENEYAFRLCDVAPGENAVFTYLYDFGDNWEHIIHVEKITKDDKNHMEHALCITGERAAPPDDCGGPYEYDEFLEAIKDPAHDRHKELMEWVGGGFDPEAFDKDKINRRLKRLVMTPRRTYHNDVL